MKASAARRLAVATPASAATSVTLVDTTPTCRYDAGSGWVDGDRFGTTLTQDEVRQFVAEYHALMSKYSRSPHEAPPGARQMAGRFFILPEDPLDSPGQPDPA